LRVDTVGTGQFNNPAFGAPTHTATEVSLSGCTVAAGQNKLLQWRQFGVEAIQLLLKP
jgi:hypothetical protein